MNLLIKDARLIDDKQDLVADLYIEKGKIRKIGKALSYNCKTIDGKDLCLLPAFVDIHAHFRDPGYTYKEDIETGSLSALRGGYTFVNLMGNTDPVCSSMEIVDDVLKRAKNLDLEDIHQSVSITKNFDGESLEHLDLLDERVKVITDDGMGIKSNIVMYKAFKKAKEKGLLILSHAEDEDLTPIDYRVSENLISFRDIYLSQVLETRLHLTHVSTKEVIEAIRRAKGKGNKYLTCDVTPHHISLWDSNEKVNP
ncbi:MAG TPA: amidohydrolase family protein, partial [Tissierellaceae bacterium]|nr:amidohydrolase family protein [Tissierellaceae bacterium]